MKKFTIFLLLIMLMATSCDSLWEHKNEQGASISFTIPQEMIDSFVQENKSAQRALSGGISRAGSSVDTSITAKASIHEAETGSVLAEQTVNFGNNQAGTINFEPLYIVGKTVYARIELTKYGHTSVSDESNHLTVVDGNNRVEFIEMGEIVLNPTKMLANLEGSVFVVKPDPSGTDLKSAITTVVGVDWTSVTEIQFVPPTGGKIIPDTDLSELFAGHDDTGLVTIKGLEYIETVYVTNMSRMFEDTHWIMELDLSSWNTSNVEDMSGMFDSAVGLHILTISGWDTSKVESMSNIFRDATVLTSLDISGWDTSSVTDMSSMFERMSALVSIEGLNNLNTSSVTTMDSMFSGSTGLTDLNLSTWDTSKVKYMENMFSGMTALTSLDITSWDTSSIVDDGASMFDSVTLDSITVGRNLTAVVSNQIQPKNGVIDGINYDGMWVKDGVEYDAIPIDGGNAVAGTYTAKRNP